MTQGRRSVVYHLDRALVNHLESMQRPLCCQERTHDDLDIDLHKQMKKQIEQNQLIRTNVSLSEVSQ